MRAIIDDPQPMKRTEGGRLKRLGWFFALWAAGVLGIAALGLLIKLALAL